MHIGGVTIGTNAAAITAAVAAVRLEGGRGTTIVTPVNHRQSDTLLRRHNRHQGCVPPRCTHSTEAVRSGTDAIAAKSAIAAATNRTHNHLATW
jgi:hypothetical protein